MRGREMKIKTLVACPRQPARLYQLAWGTQKKNGFSGNASKVLIKAASGLELGWPL